MDIDGVLQAGNAQDRFERLNDKTEMAGLYKELQDKHGIDYSRYSKYDVTAIYKADADKCIEILGVADVDD